MRVLVACEFSGVVRRAFRAAGHDAWSCDLLPAEDGGEHIQDDALKVSRLNWDMMIAHPPCTYLTYAGAQYWRDPERVHLREKAMEFFLSLYHSDIPRVAIENPRGWPTKSFRRQDQEINPFDFGEPIRKRICLWLKNLPPLFCTLGVDVRPSGSCVKKNGRKYNYYYHQGKTGHQRSRFFPGVAAAMAHQWGDYK